MRDPERIKPLLQKLEKLWETQPDIRLGQLLININRRYSKVPDLFYLEDDELDKIITELNSEIGEYL